MEDSSDSRTQRGTWEEKSHDSEAELTETSQNFLTFFFADFILLLQNRGPKNCANCFCKFVITATYKSVQVSYPLTVFTNKLPLNVPAYHL